PTPVIYTLSLHDALPISLGNRALLHREERFSCKPVEDKHKSHLSKLHNCGNTPAIAPHRYQHGLRGHIVIPNIVVHHLVVPDELDRKSTRLNSSHVAISY